MKSSASIVRCETYEEEETLKALRKAIGLLGGIEFFIQRGERVLLKPNLLIGRPPEKAVTTHPSIVKGMIRLVREADGIPLIGDSPSIGSLAKAAEKAGLKKVAEEMACPLVEFNRPVPYTKGGPARFRQIELDQTILEVDAVINLPKWKTHGQMLLTLGVKNLFGCVPGPRKALWHLRAGESRKLFAQILVDVYQLVKPRLTVLDGIVGMEGNGPNSGRPTHLGLLLASQDAVSVDLLVCDLLGISRKALLTNRLALEQGIGPEIVEVVGERLEDVKIRGFQFPPLSGADWNLPTFITRALKNALSTRPVIHAGRCVSCNRCLEICPPRALTRRGEGLRLDYGKCIRCFCCQEVCSEGAITIEPGWAVKLVSRKMEAESR